ncbi:hypothetical protein [Pantanalinema sp. GBBB05]|uniref:hypothetical protein n=1 Tax=Pantanalinema sp. GBBB05 TaxID=2604139 RepID=UPI001E0DBE12|nr:hypothetical protein [Pantanalinema sp. GBBB05]
MPLAVYREVAAHLCLVAGVQTELLAQQSQRFDYNLSQVDSLQIDYTDNDPSCRAQVQQILAYYSDRYGAWETVEPSKLETQG